MHLIQSHILKQLTLNEKARYVDLKPQGVESNRFVYHLNRLINDGFVRKTNHGYELTPRGKRYVDKLSLKNFITRTQPKIVTVLICKNKNGEHLVYKRKHQPFYGLINFPYGKLHLGESINEAAHRELREKAGLTIQKLEHCGDVYLALRDKGEFVTHMLCHVFKGNNPKGTLKEETSLGYCTWKKLKEVDENEFIPGFLSIERLSQSKKHFFKELFI